VRVVGAPAERIAHWLAERIPHFVVGSTPFTTVALVKDSQATMPAILAAVVYDNFTRINVDAHIAVAHRHAMTPEFLGAIFRYPFLQLKVARITCKVAASNAASRRLCRHFGFLEEGLCRKALPNGEDLVLFGMLKSECRWLGVGKNGKELRTRSA
jgi:RimJ/RimL family protein N-acetyltransferase